MPARKELRACAHRAIMLRRSAGPLPDPMAGSAEPHVLVRCVGERVLSTEGELSASVGRAGLHDPASLLVDLLHPDPPILTIPGGLAVRPGGGVMHDRSVDGGPFWGPTRPESHPRR